MTEAIQNNKVTELPNISQSDLKAKTLLQNWYDHKETFSRLFQNYYNDDYKKYTGSSSGNVDLLRANIETELSTEELQAETDRIVTNGYTDRNGVFIEGGFDAFFAFVDDYNDGLIRSRWTPTLRSFGEKMQRVLDDNQNGVGLSIGDNNVVQLFNKTNQYRSGEDGEPQYPESGTLRELDQTADNYLSLEDVDFFEGVTETNLESRWQSYMYDPVRLGYKFGTNTSDLLSPAVIEMLNNIGFISGRITDEEGGSVFSPEAGNGYIYRWYGSQTSSVDPLSDAELQSAAEGGWTVGQLLGENFEQRRGESIESFALLSFQDFFGLGEATAGIEARLEDLRREVYDKYLPGLERINFPYTVPARLEVVLKQNLLLPDYHTNKLDELKGKPAADAVFLAMYSDRNRTLEPESLLLAQELVDLNQADRFDKGWFGGVAINDLQRQAESFPGGATPTTILDFVEHDYRYLRNDFLERGYKSNIGGTIGFPDENADAEESGVGGGSLVEAVEEFQPVFDTSSDLSRSLQRRVESYQAGKTQFFPFLIETDNRTIGAEDKEKRAFFQALIDSMTETVNPVWQQKSFFGRTENIQTYTSTERNLDLSFSIYADNMRDLANVKHRVNFLVQQSYGQYEQITDFQNRITAGPIVRLTLGDLYVGVPGIITSLTVNWNGLGGGSPSWEMTRGLMMPWICSINMGYKILHDQMPDRETDFYDAMQDGIDGEHYGNGDWSGGKDDRRLIPINEPVEVFEEPDLEPEEDTAAAPSSEEDAAAIELDDVERFGANGARPTIT
jgi:hypothetical protein